MMSSTAVTLNKCFEGWCAAIRAQVMAGTLIDPRFHHCHNGETRGISYRMRDHQNLLRFSPDHCRRKGVS